PFASLFPFDLSAIKGGLADGARHDQLSLQVPHTLWHVLDRIQFLVNPSASRTDVVLYCLRLGQSRLSALPAITQIDHDFTLLLGWNRQDLTAKIPRWAYESLERCRRLVLRGVRTGDQAWATHRIVSLGMTHAEIHRACLLAGLVGSPVGVSREDLVWQTEGLMVYLDARAALLTRCVTRASHAPHPL